MIEIRRIRVGEADLFKKVRLTSLHDAPNAFSSTHASALQRSDESWREQADRTAQGTDRATFFAFSDGMPIGMAALYRLEGPTDAGEIVQVWIAPEYRGTNVAWDMMDVIFEWAGKNSFHVIKATVTNGNTRAIHFYTKYGFSVSQTQSGNTVFIKEVIFGK